MIEKVIDSIQRFNMLEKGDSVVIGLSGGADSIALSHILLKLKDGYSLKLTAVHINHNIRKEGAVNDQHFVEDFCKKNSLPLKVFSLDIKGIAKKNSLTLEEAGRQQRYLAFEGLGADKIAVAHNLNDNAETMIMRLCRGTGLKGMGGILPVRDNIIRPLIMCSRAEIEKYCAQNGLEFCTDETNFENDYTRNKIRHLILPVLEEINPGAVGSLGKNAYLFRQENEYIENIAKKAYSECKDQNCLCIDRLKGLDTVIRSRVFRLACEDAVGLKDIALEHIEIIEEMLDKSSGKRVDLPKGLCVVKENGRLVFSKKSEDFCVLLKPECELEVCGIKYILSREKKQGYKNYGIYADSDTFYIRNRRDGDIYMRGDGRQIKLKKVFIDKKIPVSLRGSLALLACGEYVYWAEGLKNKFKEENYYLNVWEDKK